MNKRKAILLLLLFLLGGAIINVAVVYTVLVLCDPQDFRELRDANPRWLVDVGVIPRSRSWMQSMTSGVVVTRHNYFDAFYSAGGTKTVTQILVEDTRAGWPVRCLDGAVIFDSTKGEYRTVTAVRDYGHARTMWHLPIGPIWPGFAINTVFYAMILWLLIRGPFVLRRRIRLKRGRCPMCAYDLQGAHEAGCSECGWNRPEFTAEGAESAENRAGAVSRRSLTYTCEKCTSAS